MARRLVFTSFLTLDGVMQAPGSEVEDTEGGFKYGGWQVPFFSDVDDNMSSDFKKAGALLLGRKTYDIFASYWPFADKNNPYTEFMNSTPKYVASRTKRNLEWRNSTLLEGDLEKAIGKLKQEGDQNIIVFGSSDLGQTLMRLNLIDEFALMIHPLVLGSGKRLFKENSPRLNLEVVKSKTTKNGVLALTYNVKNAEE